MSGVPRGIVGRRRELEAVQGFMSGGAAGPTAFTIAGPAGVGKSTVWRAGAELAAADGLRVLVARPSGAEASLSFAALADLLGGVEPEVLETLPAPQRHALDVALLRESAQQRVDARAVSTATYNVLRELAAPAGVLVAVDDAQWLDDASSGALQFALRRLEGTRVRVLAGVRVDEVRPRTFELELPPEARTELALTPLSTSALHDVIRERLGWTPRRPALVHIAQASAGNAYYAIEIARMLGEGNDVTELLVPPTLQGVVHSRMERLPPETRDALLRSAALATPTTGLVSEGALRAAQEDGLVAIDADGRIHFEHPLVAAVIFDSAPHAVRRRVHRELASLVSDKEERARHLALGVDAADDDVAAELDEAAAHAARRGAAIAAAELSRLAVSSTVARQGAARVRRSIALARHLLDAGDDAGARDALEECDPAWIDGDLRAELLGELGWCLWYAGDHDEGYRLACAGIALAADRELAARLHGHAAWLSQDADLERAIGHDTAALELLDPERSPGRYSWTLLHCAYLRLLDGQGSDEASYRRGVELQERGVEWEDTSPVVGMWPVLHDDFAQARAIYEVGLARARAEGDEQSVQGTLLRLAEVACWTGRWREADAFASSGVELADRIGSSAYLGSALYARALVDAHLGRVDDAIAGANRVLDVSQQESLGHWVLGFVALSLGRSTDAAAHYDRAAVAVGKLGQREPARFRFQPDHLEAVVETGDVAYARELLAALEARATVFPRPWILATSARCRALVLAAEGELTEARAAAESALDHHEQLDMPFERARTLFALGVVLRRLKQKRRARDVFRECAAAFAALPAPLWVERTQRELERVASRQAAAGLTATESRIARLAADGFSNSEIAARVFVSRKTVEANLARAYRKLDISSRAQLDRALRDVGDVNS